MNLIITFVMYNETLKTNRSIRKQKALLEAFNQQTVDEAVHIIKALQSIDFSTAGMKSLASARDTAIQDVDSIVSGQSQRGIVQRFASMFTKNADKNPLLDVLAFCDALRNFFIGLAKYVDARKTGIDNPNDKLLKNIVLKNAETPSIESMTNDKKQLKMLQDLIINGLKPEAYLKKVASKAWQQKYIKNKYADIAKDVMNSSVGNIEKIAADINEKFENVSTIARNALNAGGATSKNSVGTTGTQQATGTQPGASSNVSEPTANTGRGGTNDTEAKKTAVNTASELYKTLHDRFGDIPEETVKKVIAILAYHDNVKI